MVVAAHRKQFAIAESIGIAERVGLVEVTGIVALIVCMEHLNHQLQLNSDHGCIVMVHINDSHRLNCLSVADVADAVDGMVRLVLVVAIQDLCETKI